MSLKDLISKKAVIQAVDDDDRNGMWSSFMSHEDAEDFKKEIKKLPPAFAGMTNREVIKVIFPKAKIYKSSEGFEQVLFNSLCTLEDMTGEWLNAPYKKGGAE